MLERGEVPIQSSKLLIPLDMNASNHKALKGIPLSQVLWTAVQLWFDLEIDDDELIEIAVRDVSYQIKVNETKKVMSDFDHFCSLPTWFSPQGFNFIHVIFLIMSLLLLLLLLLMRLEPNLIIITIIIDEARASHHYYY